MTEYLQYSLFMPSTNWTAPAYIPEFLLNTDEPISIDTETFDPLLTKRGPSWRYRQGHIAGICLATDRSQWYFPVDHLGGNNLPKETVFDFFSRLLHNPKRKVFLANGSYDLGWLWYEKILHDDITRWADFEDVILNEALICEEHPGGYSLDAISKRRLSRSKDETLLVNAARDLGLDPKKDLWKFPARYVGPYGEGDARNTFDCGIDQQKELDKEDLRRIWSVEQQIMPLLHLTTRNGIHLNIDKAEQLNQEMLVIETQLREALGVEPWTDGEHRILRAEGFKLPKTEKGNDSCDKKYLKSVSDFNEVGEPLNTPAKILTLRTINRLRQVYVEDAIKWAQNGIVHPEFMQMATEEGGARSGRMASKNPNFQQIPSRTAWGKKIRKLYYTSEGKWGKFDYSSQEPRWQVHYGIHCSYEGANEAADAFMMGKKLYTFMEENVPGLSYADAKMLVLAKSYGMGIATLAETLNTTKHEAETLVEKFDRMVPYIGQLAQHTQAIANKKGYLKTILGRRRRFIYWESPDSPGTPPIFGFKAAKARFKKGRIRRAYTHKAFNALIQGTSADQTKKAMLDVWKELKRVPLCQVHDELDYKIMNDSEVPKIKHLMEITIKDTFCPFEVECDIGETWQ